MSARRKSRRPLLVFSAGNLPVRSQSKTVSFATPSSRAASLRPLNALAENFWRVTQAIPDAPIGWRVTVAFYLTKVSMSDKPHTDLTSLRQCQDFTRSRDQTFFCGLDHRRHGHQITLAGSGIATQLFSMFPV